MSKKAAEHRRPRRFFSITVLSLDLQHYSTQGCRHVFRGQNLAPFFSSNFFPAKNFTTRDDGLRVGNGARVPWILHGLLEKK